LPDTGGIAVATNAALALASGDFVALLDHDDELAPRALGRVAAELEAHPETDVVFSDEDQLVAGRRCRPYFKPGWNPDLMLSQNLVSHLGVYRRALVERLGGMRPDFVGSQDYDLALRATSAVPGERIRHVPEVLYHWRQHDGSYSARRAAQCQAAARAALASVLGEGAVVEANPDIPQWTRIGYLLRSPEPLVSLIVPAGAAAPADAGYGALEVCGDDPERARGEVLVFWGKGLLPARAGWLRELVSQALRPEVGCAGPRLERPDGRIAHAGFVLHPEEVAQTLAPCSDAGDPGYLGHFLLCRTVSAVALAGMAVRREVFMDLGGFDRRAGRFADVDFCLRLGELGLRCVWTPLARLRTRGLPRAGADAAGAAFMRERWGERLARDPYANPNLVVRAGNLELAERDFKRVLFFRKEHSYFILMGTNGS